MITYNHEKYIRDAIEGVIMQKTKFAVELIIGEDHSSDQTRKICQEYAEKYSDRIFILAERQNLGTLRNFIRCLGECRGKFIAICEGDDYWTDELKLAKQIDFMERNPGYAMVHTNKNVLLDNKIYPGGISSNSSGNSFEDLLCSNSICTLTVLARAGIFKESIKKILDKAEKLISVAPDYSFWLEISLRYKIGFIEEVTGVYRFLHESMVHTSNRSKAYNFEKSIIRIKEFYFQEYLRESPDKVSAFKNRFNENIFHSHKRLLLDYGIHSVEDVFYFLKINPLFYLYLIFKKIQRGNKRYYKSRR
jgi:glycosyltransferase involved in cell wall biosynthesis